MQTGRELQDDGKGIGKSLCCRYLSVFVAGLDALNAFSILSASDRRKDVAESFDGASWVAATASV